MFDEEPQGVIFSLARAQHWLRCVALLLGSLSTYCCLSARCADAGIQPHRDLCLPCPTGILGRSGTEPQRSVLIHQQWYSGLPRTGDACVAVAAPRDPTESCIVERELPHRECAGWMTLEQDLSDTNALTSNNHILHGQNYLWLKTSEISGNWKSLPFFLMVQWTI